VCFGIPSIAVKADSPWTTLKDFTTYVKEHPGLQVAWTGRGATPHLTAMTLSKLTGIELKGVPYGDDTGSLTALLGGDVKVSFLNALATVQHVKAGAIRVLAIHAPKRISFLPDVPTYIEAGVDLPLGILSFVAVFGPPGIPGEAKRILERTAQKAGNNADTIAGLEKLGVSPHFSSGKDLQAILDQYRNHVGKQVKELGLFQE
jgi:tripartite-type tricarboxylate transporter receptor subunit TctC